MSAEKQSSRKAENEEELEDSRVEEAFNWK
jgi:hypothetical protein